MIYTLYHVIADTRMEENGVPWYVDVIGGVIDMAIIYILIVILTGGF